jgi:hypothetical protein
MKHVEKHYTLRIQRRNGTSKLLLGVTASPRKIGASMQIRLPGNELVTVRIVNHAGRDEPAEAIEIPFAARRA